MLIRRVLSTDVLLCQTNIGCEVLCHFVLRWHSKGLLAIPGLEPLMYGDISASGFDNAKFDWWLLCFFIIAIAMYR